jgi:hypothetical protein
MNVGMKDFGDEACFWSLMGIAFLHVELNLEIASLERRSTWPAGPFQYFIRK